MKIKKECDACHKFYNKIYQWQGHFYCYKCIKKERKPVLPYKKFKLEPHYCYRANIGFTKTQKQKLDKRVIWLFGVRRKNLAAYIKTLILYDLNSWRENDRNN